MRRARAYNFSLGPHDEIFLDYDDANIALEGLHNMEFVLFGAAALLSRRSDGGAFGEGVCIRRRAAHLLLFAGTRRKALGRCICYASEYEV
jgi:hypothetical protein